jgi:hypothetical protein
MVLFGMACASSLAAQPATADRLQSDHAREDEVWAKKSGLPISEVRAIRIAAGITDTTPATRIDNIDASSLRHRNQILFVEGFCPRLHVLERKDDGLHEIWSLSKLPVPGWTASAKAWTSERNLCGLGGPTRVHVTADGTIVVEVPSRMDPFERSIPLSTYTFNWDGSEYKLTEQNR